MNATVPPNVLVVGVGGPTSSGKTTLAKHLLNLLLLAARRVRATDVTDPGTPWFQAFILHQDDFAMPEEQLPWNQEGQFRDWDTPEGSVDYHRMASTIARIRETGVVPPDHVSHEHLNEHRDVPLSASVREACTDRLAACLRDYAQGYRAAEGKGGDSTPASSKAPPTPLPLVVVLADGFLLYYDEELRSQMDVRIFLRCHQATVRSRREARSGYNTAEGSLWKDPPGYFDLAIWPGYVLAHRRVFENGDVERGAPVSVDSSAARRQAGVDLDAGESAASTNAAAAAAPPSPPPRQPTAAAVSAVTTAVANAPTPATTTTTAQDLHAAPPPPPPSRRRRADGGGPGAPVERLVVLDGEGGEGNVDAAVRAACEVIVVALRAQGA